MQHQKLEKRESWPGFESATSNDIDLPTGPMELQPCELQRSFSVSARPARQNTTTDHLLQCRLAMSTNANTAEALAGCADSPAGGAGVPKGHGNVPFAAAYQDTHTECRKTNGKADKHKEAAISMRTDGIAWPMGGLIATPAKTGQDHGISSQKLHAMEAQLGELHEQLQTLKNAHEAKGTRAPSSVDACDNTEQQCIGDVKRQLDDACAEKKDLRHRIAQLEGDVASCHQKSKKECLARERLQAELRRLADMIEMSHVDDADNRNDATDCRPIDMVDSSSPVALTEGDVNALREQLRIFEEDFTNERSDSERLRVQNMRLMRELEEAKRVIEEQQRQLLLYAHVTSSEGQTGAVLSPINDSLLDRRSRSVPSTPNSSPHGFGLGTRYTYTGREAVHGYEGLAAKNNEFLRKVPPEMRPLSDVVPRGNKRNYSPLDVTLPRDRSTPARFPLIDDVFPVSTRLNTGGKS